VIINVSPTTSAVYQYNTVYSAGTIALEVEYVDPGKETGTETIKYDHNIFVGFPSGEREYPTPIYSNTDLKMFTNPGASFSNNVTYHPRSNWKCPATLLHEVAGSCSNPHLKDETWHAYGYGDVSPVKATEKSLLESGPKSSSEDEQDRILGGSHASIVVKSVGVAILVTSVWGGLRYFLGRETKT
jgi:hypothetical protein